MANDSGELQDDMITVRCESIPAPKTIINTPVANHQPQEHA